MTKRGVLIAMAIASATGAHADTAEARTSVKVALGVDEARDELFGVEFFGEVGRPGQPWTECIEPNGKTVYRIGSETSVGMMRVSPAGEACFTYETGGDACFRVTRTEDGGYAFWGVGAPFVATKVRRNVETCSETPAIS
ncbi:MAG: hypothetical protein AAFQ67_07550 [Pseudomonadota bacterium]